MSAANADTAWDEATHVMLTLLAVLPSEKQRAAALHLSHFLEYVTEAHALQRNGPERAALRDEMEGAT